ncbi:ADP-ribosylation/crystallin J1 [Niabella sp. 22666]|uniref:ADP-ribosylation/crystallin J1 n=1 Tax=Niabella sp. 22666 TaxID=3453954 RepID=UPI003F824323
MKKLTRLFRPVGWTEMKLIQDSGFRKFPPRLDWQPIFYPVLNLEYAQQIAREWNTNDLFSGYVGYVTRFDVHATFLSRYPVQNVGADQHDELWIPSADMHLLNQHIVGRIDVTDAYYGKLFNNTFI